MFIKHIILIVVVLVVYSAASCIHGTSLLKRQETPGGKVKVANFGYTGFQGPLNWAALTPQNNPCSTGKLQSPINIDDTIELAKEIPVINFPDVESAEFENLGTTLEVIVNGTTKFAGKEFLLRQFHFHTPSEHRIAEEYFPLEMHMVHEAADGSGGIAVIAVLFQLSEDGSTTDLLTAATKNIGEVNNPGSVTETGPLKFEALVQHLQTKPLFQYTGSLTTPPCAEGLTFLVTKDPLPTNVKTFNAIKRVIKFNSRYTQSPLNETNLLELASSQRVGEPTQSASTKTPTSSSKPVRATTEGSVTETTDEKTASVTTSFQAIATTTPLLVETITTLPPQATKTNTEHQQHCILGACTAKSPR